MQRGRSCQEPGHIRICQDQMQIWNKKADMKIISAIVSGSTSQIPKNLGSMSYEKLY